ncbi:hypothetical protein MYX82_12275 [Acidobacteria bacterium AH-259-D05]|nr:hypothetical protein [Acidobacteria bacterium AH-259-D05]
MTKKRKNERTNSRNHDGIPLVIELNGVIVAVTDERPRILVVKHLDHPAKMAGQQISEDSSPSDALPFGPLDAAADRTLELGLRRWVWERTGIELGYVEQLYTFGDRNRDPREFEGGPRVISVPYLALVKEGQLPGLGEAKWRDWYEYLPWEDWLSRRPSIIDEKITPALDRWVKKDGNPEIRCRRLERVEIVFGLGGATWDEERVLERYELLYEIGLVAEQARDTGLGITNPQESPETCREPLVESGRSSLGRSMALDHRRILATAMGRLRGKIKYRPVVFELLPPTFTLLQLQRVVEALAGIRLHKQNFRRFVEKGGLVEDTGQSESKTGGRPAKLFGFRREVLRERPAPGVGLPGAAKIANP